MDLFSYDAAQQHEERAASRTASVLFNVRASERFEPFLRQAANRDEFWSRLALLDGDLSELVVAVAKEAGWDGEPVPQGSNPIVNAFINRIAGGAFCDDCRKWKSGPKAGTCECGPGETSEPEDDGALSDDVSAVGKESNAEECDCGEQHCDNCNPPKTASDDNLGGKGEVSGPGIDKSRGSAGDVPDTDGGPYKTVTQDVKDGPDWSNEDRAQGVVLDTNTDISKVDTQPVIHTDTWSGKGGQATPVTTSKFLSSATIFDAIVLFGD